MLPTRFLVLLKTLVEALVMRLGISLVKLVIQLVIPQKKLDTLRKPLEHARQQARDGVQMRLNSVLTRIILGKSKNVKLRPNK